MSSINDLIVQHCPGGVPLRTLGDVGTFIRGGGMQKANLVDSGFPAIHYGQIHTFYDTSATATRSFVTPEFASKLRKAEPGDLVLATTSEDDEAVGKAVAWLGDSAAAVSGDAYIYRHSLVPKYVAYYMQSRQFQDQKKRGISGTKVRRISGESLAKIRVPVPPAEVQEEVVRILDLFRRLGAELEAQLEAELEARTGQYAHYLDELFSFPETAGVPRVPMGEVGEFIRGRRFTKQDYVEQGGIPVIHYGEIYTHFGTTADTVRSYVRPEMANNLRFARPGDVILTDVGETVDDVGKPVAWLGSSDVAIHDHCYAFRHSMNPAFVAYYMQTNRFRIEKAKYVARTKVKTLSMSGLAKVRLPVPEPAEQERIVDMLDQFCALVTDASSALSAEIAARRKQYEYYRDRLLTFQDAGVPVGDVA